LSYEVFQIIKKVANAKKKKNTWINVNGSQSKNKCRRHSLKNIHLA